MEFKNLMATYEQELKSAMYHLARASAYEDIGFTHDMENEIKEARKDFDLSVEALHKASLLVE